MAGGNGFRPVNDATQPYTGGTVPFRIAKNYGSNIFYGDFVRRVNGGYIEVNDSVADHNLDDTLGVFMGCNYNDANGTPTWSQYYPAGQNVDGIVAFVAGTDPQTRYKVKWTNAAGTADSTGTIAKVGLNIDIAYRAGSTITGDSGSGADAATAAIVGSANFRVVDVVNEPASANEYQTASTTYTHAIVIVQPGLHANSNPNGI